MQGVEAALSFLVQGSATQPNFQLCRVLGHYLTSLSCWVVEHCLCTGFWILAQGVGTLPDFPVVQGVGVLDLQGDVVLL